MVTAWTCRREAGRIGAGDHIAVVGGAQDQVGDQGDSKTLGDQPEDGDVVLGLERDVRGEPLRRTHLQEVAAAAGTAGDPVLGCQGRQVDDLLSGEGVVLR